MQNRVSRRNHVYRGVHIVAMYLARITERFVCGGDAALSPITSTT